MSSSTAPAETRDRGRLAGGLQALLAVAYLVVAHVARVSGDGRFAAVALLLVVALVLVPALLRGRLPAWLLMAVAALLAAWLAPSTVLWLPLRLVPVAFVGLVAFGFARTLLAGRVPLVPRIVAALERSNWVLAGPNGAAARLGVKRSTLQFRMRKLGIHRPHAH